MNLPETLSNAQSWTVIGPMGPKLSESLAAFPILAVDGGAAFAPRVDVWTGDHDSLKVSLVCEHQWVLKPNKDLSDLAAAFQILAGTRAREFHLWGFMGGRIDHELFNLGEASKFLTDRPAQKLSFYNSQGKILLQLFGAGTHNFHSNSTFSVGTLSPCQVKLTGQCRYQIPEFATLSALSSHGLSNIGAGLIKIENSGPVIIVFPEVT